MQVISYSQKQAVMHVIYFVCETPQYFLLQDEQAAHQLSTDLDVL